MLQLLRNDACHKTKKIMYQVSKGLSKHFKVIFFLRLLIFVQCEVKSIRVF